MMMISSKTMDARETSLYQIVKTWPGGTRT